MRACRSVPLPEMRTTTRNVTPTSYRMTSDQCLPVQRRYRIVTVPRASESERLRPWGRTPDPRKTQTRTWSVLHSGLIPSWPPGARARARAKLPPPVDPWQPPLMIAQQPMDRIAWWVAIAACAASNPLSSRDSGRPARSTACCSSSQVSTPNPIGTPVLTHTWVMPLVAA